MNLLINEYHTHTHISNAPNLVTTEKLFNFAVYIHDYSTYTYVCTGEATDVLLHVDMHAYIPKYV
jgi:hypothetical protein